MASASSTTDNVDLKTVEGFGMEWERFDQSKVSLEELAQVFEEYFTLFPWERLPKQSRGFDVGCGSGRWARFAAERVGELHCVDASERALSVARRKLSHLHNCVFHLADVEHLPFGDCSMDFGYSLGVLHHIPDTAAAIKRCAEKLKPGAPLLLYLYYSFENRPRWYSLLWRLTDVFRRIVIQFPYRVRFAISDLCAVFVYYPMARCALLLDKCGIMPRHWPLASYRDRSLYTMRTDSLDRFAVVEHRFSRQQIRTMMESAGLENIQFKDTQPYWSAIGYKTRNSNDRVA
jgi:ubiquinone/menaquinone biosynthesis C-methylase UbiE